MDVIKEFTMIIDFSFPTLHKNEWVVKVVRGKADGGIFPDVRRFEDKDDAFEYYEQIRKEWQGSQVQRDNQGQTFIPFKPTTQLALQFNQGRIK